MSEAKRLLDLAARVEALEQAIRWVGDVVPSTVDGGANVHMTWDEFNEMRRLMGCPPIKPRPSRSARAAAPEPPPPTPRRPAMASEHTDGRYYARDGLVYKAPVQHDKPDGSTSFSLGFPVCKVLEYVGEDAAETVALLMNQGEQATHLREVNAALRKALSQITWELDCINTASLARKVKLSVGDSVQNALDQARAALARAKGEQA
jgi:hypothetical protein